MNICVVGAGAWGTAFSLHLTRLGHQVSLLPRRPEQAARLQAEHENRDYLPGVPLPESLNVTADPEAVTPEVEVLLLACPVQGLRETCQRLCDGGAATPRLALSLAKGLELGSHLRPSQLIAETLPETLPGMLTGPTHALEVAQGLPAAMVLAASHSDPILQEAQAAMSGPTLRIYTSDDLIGVEFGGSLKNIYAIAAGCADGLRLGDNAKAALLTRALAEMVRVGTALGARAETFYGLSGFGDLVATCHGAWSRNREFGQRIAEGRPVAELLDHRRTVVEGYGTTRSFAELCRERGIDAPILSETHAILYSGRRPADALTALMTRELKHESASVE